MISERLFVRIDFVAHERTNADRTNSSGVLANPSRGDSECAGRLVKKLLVTY